MFSSTISPPGQIPYASALWSDASKGFGGGDSKCVGGFSSFATASTLSTRSDDAVEQARNGNRDPELNEIFNSSPDDDHGMGRSELSTSGGARDDSAGASGGEGSFFFPSLSSSSSSSSNSRAKPPLPGVNGLSHFSSSTFSSSLTSSTPSTATTASGGRGGGAGGGRPLPDQNAFDPPSVQSGVRGGSRTWYQSPSSSSNSNGGAVGKSKAGNGAAAAPACPPTPVRTPAWAAHAAAAAEAEASAAAAAAQSSASTRFVPFPGSQEFTGTLDFEDAVEGKEEEEDNINFNHHNSRDRGSSSSSSSSSSSMLLSGSSPVLASSGGGTSSRERVSNGGDGTPGRRGGGGGGDGGFDNSNLQLGGAGPSQHHHLWRQTSINETKTLMYSSYPGSAHKVLSTHTTIEGGGGQHNTSGVMTINGTTSSAIMSSIPPMSDDASSRSSWNVGATTSGHFATSSAAVPLPSSSSSSSSSSSTLSSISFERDFAVLRHLGHGSFSRVMEALHRPSNQRYAVKRAINIMKNKSDRDRLLREFRLATRAGPHPNIVHYSVAWQEAGYLYFATELCAGGNLRQLQERLPEGTPMPERTIWTFIAHVASGLAHLHSKGIVHLDIKPENVFISSASDGACLKIGDFGLAADFTSSSPQQLASSHQRQQHGFPLTQDSMPFGNASSAINSNGAAMVPSLSSSSSSDCSFAMNVSVSSSDCGDVDDNDNEGDSRFMALELLSQGGRAPAADVFSLGMSAFEMAWDIAAPAEGEPWRDVREGRLPPLPPHCNPSNRSLDLLTLVSAMLRPEPSTRPTAAEIYSLPQVQYVLANGADPLLAFHSKEIDEARNGGGSSGIAAAGRSHAAHHQNKQPDSTSVLPSLLAVPKNNASVPALVSALASAAALGDSNKPSNVMMGRSSSYREEEEKDEDKSSGLVARIAGATSGGGGGDSRLGSTASAPLPAQIQSSRTLASPSAAAPVHQQHQQPAALIRGRTLFVTSNDDEEETVEAFADSYNHQQDDDQADVSETSIINKEEHGPDNVFFQSSQPSDAGIEGNELSSSSSSSSSSSAASMMTESDLPSNNNRLRLRRAIDFVNESTDIFVASSSSPTTQSAAATAAALPPARIVSNAGIFEQQMSSSSSSSSTTSFFPSIPPPLGSQSLQGQASKQPQQPALSAQPPALFKPYSVSARKHPRDYDKHQSSSSSTSSSLFAPAPFGGAFSFASPKATATAHPMAAPSSIGALDMRSLQAQMPSATPGRGTRARTQRKRGGVMQAQGLTNTLGRIDSPTPHQQLANDSIADGSESGFISSQPLSAISSTSSSQSSSQQTNTATGSHMMSSVSSSEEGSGGGIRIFNPQQASNILINNEDSTSRFRTSSPDFASSSAGGSSYPRNVSTGAGAAALSTNNSEFRLDESAVSYNPHDESVMSNSAVDTAFFSTRKVPLHYFASAQTLSNSLSINVNAGGGGGGPSWHASGAPSPSEGGVTPIAKRERVGSSPITSHMQPSSLSSTTAMSNTVSRSSEAHAGILGSGEYSMHHHQQQQQQQQQQHHLMRPTPVLAASSHHYLHRPFPTPLPSSSSSSLLGGYDNNTSHHMQLATHKVWGGGKVNQRGDDSAAPMSIVAPSAHHHHLLHSNFASSSSDRMETSHTEGEKVVGGLSLRMDAPAAAAAAMQLKWDTDDDFEEPEGLLRRAQTSPIQMVTSNSSATSPTATSPKQYPLQQVGGTSFASRLQQTRSNAIAAPVKSRLSSSSSPRLSFSGGGGAPTPVRDFLPPSSSNRGGGEGSLAGRGSAQQRESRGTIVTTDGEQASSPTSPRTVAESSFAAQNNARRTFNAFGTTSSYPGGGQSIDTTSSMSIPTLLPIPTRHQSIPLRIQVNMSRPGTAFDGQTTPLNEGFVTPFGQGIVLDAKHWMANM